MTFHDLTEPIKFNVDLPEIGVREVIFPKATASLGAVIDCPKDDCGGTLPVVFMSVSEPTDDTSPMYVLTREAVAGIMSNLLLADAESFWAILRELTVNEVQS